MEVKYIEPFINAAKTVFQGLFNDSIEVEKPYIIIKEDPHHWDITGIIGIAGETRGIVALSFYLNTAIQLTNLLSNTEVNTLDDSVIDAVGELVNMVAGNAKKGLEEYKLMISLPGVVTGEDHSIQWPGKNIPIIGIPFSINQQEFQIAVGLENIINL